MKVIGILLCCIVPPLIFGLVLIWIYEMGERAKFKRKRR